MFGFQHAISTRNDNATEFVKKIEPNFKRHCNIYINLGACSLLMLL